MKPKLWLSAVAVSAALCSGAAAQVTGTVKLDGKAPEPKEIDMKAVKECADQHPDPQFEETIVASEAGELMNVIVSVKKEEGMDLPGDVPKDPAVLDQKGCMYIPHVLPLMVGQQLMIKNDDAFLHNVHSFSTANPPFNFGQPNKDPGKKVDPMKAVETFKVKCDVHPWMLAHVRVFDHPYFATSGEDGKFSIKGVPDGEYTFVAWHETLGEQEAKGTVTDGKAEVNFTFKAAGATGPDTPAKVILASDGAAESCPTASCCSVKAPDASVVKIKPAAPAQPVAAQAKAN